MTQPDDELESSLEEVARLFPSPAFASLQRYAYEILRWNARAGLVSKSQPVAAIRRLLIESAELGEIVAREVASSATVRAADVGSGGGFPGLVWRLRYPDWELVLIERREKKTTFLEHVVRRLGVSRIEVVTGDAREVARRDRFREHFDIVATIAVGEPNRVGPQIEGLLANGGLFASTLPEAAAAPERCAPHLVRAADIRGQFGRYALYRKRV